MDTNALFEAVRLILKQRFLNPWLIRFDLSSSTQDNMWGATVTVCSAPETDAVVKYIGGGGAVHEAAFDLFKKVVNDTPVNYEGGLG